MHRRFYHVHDLGKDPTPTASTNVGCDFLWMLYESFTELETHYCEVVEEVERQDSHWERSSNIATDRLNVELSWLVGRSWSQVNMTLHADPLPSYEEAIKERNGLPVHVAQDKVACTGEKRYSNKAMRRNYQREHWDEGKKGWEDEHRLFGNHFQGLWTWAFRREPSRSDKILTRIFGPPSGCKLQAVFDFDAEIPSDLSFARGQVIQL